MSFPFSREILHLIDQYQYPALFLLLLIEESGIPIPVPGDGLMMFAGYRVATGHLQFLPAFAVMEAGTLLGASILHWIGDHGGRPLLARYGRFLHLNEERLDLAEHWFRKHGLLAVLLGRMIPGLRIATSFLSGVFEVPYRRFVPYAAIGSSVYILFFMFLGLGLGREARRIIRLLLPHPFLFAAVALLIAAIALLLWLGRRVRR